MSRSHPYLILAAITVLGAVLRLVGLDTGQYTYDDEIAFSPAWHLAREGRMPGGVPSTPGLVNGVVVPYLLSIPVVFGGHELHAAILVASISALSIPLVYVAGSIAIGRRAGLIAALLAAVNPYLVEASRRAWVNGLTAPAAIVVLLATSRALSTQRIREWIVAGAALGAGGQVHLSSLGMLPSFLVALLPFAARVGVLRLIAAGLATALVLLPLLLANLAWYWRIDTRLRYVPELIGVTLSQVQVMVTGVAYQSLTGHAARILDATAFPFSVVDAVARFLAALGIGWLLAEAWRRRSTPSTAATCLLAALTVLIPALSVAVGSTLGILVPYPHTWYLFNLVPGLLLGMALVLDRLCATVVWLGSILLATLVAAQVILWVPFILVQHEYWPEAGYEMPWRWTEEMANTAARLAADSDGFVVVGSAEGKHGAYAITAALPRRYPRTRPFDGRDGLLFRTDGQGFFVSTNDELEFTRLLRDDLAAEEVFAQSLPGSGHTRRILTATPSSILAWAEQALVSTGASDSTARNMTYERAAILPPRSKDTPHRLAILWRFERDPPEPVFTRFTFFLSGHELARDEHMAYPVGGWQQGDWLSTEILSVFGLPPAALTGSEVTVRVSHFGQYTGRSWGEPLEFQARSAGPSSALQPGLLQ